MKPSDEVKKQDVFIKQSNLTKETSGVVFEHSVGVVIKI